MRELKNSYLDPTCLISKLTLPVPGAAACEHFGSEVLLLTIALDGAGVVGPGVFGGNVVEDGAGVVGGNVVREGAGVVGPGVFGAKVVGGNVVGELGADVPTHIVIGERIYQSYIPLPTTAALNVTFAPTFN
jgi:hypothetical protein